jgi:hypothetical protein
MAPDGVPLTMFDSLAELMKDVVFGMSLYFVWIVTRHADHAIIIQLTKHVSIMIYYMVTSA